MKSCRTPASRNRPAIPQKAIPIPSRQSAVTASIPNFSSKLDKTSELEKTIAERTAKLRDSIAELEAFSYTLSHDLRAPLRNICGLTELTLDEDGASLDSKAKDRLLKVLMTAQRMDRLVQDVLVFSRVSRHEMDLLPLDVEKLLNAIIRERPDFQPPNAQIQIDSPLHPICGDYTSLTQCFTNLLSNAVKFVQPAVTPLVRVSSQVVGESILLSFADNGIGIPSHVHSRVFGMLQRFNKEYDGNGIGLAIAKKAVERMGGEIGFESDLGKGSRFWIKLRSPSPL